MTKIFAVAAVAGIATAANAGFSVSAVDNGDPFGVGGEGLTVSGNLYQDALGADFVDGINAALFGVFPSAEFDSAWALQTGEGAVFDGGASPTVTSGNDPFAGGESWFRTSFTQSSDTDGDGLEGIFIGRLSYTGTLSGGIALGNFDGGNDGIDGNLIIDLGGTATLGGVTVEFVAIQVDNSAGGAALDGFTTVDLVVREVPAPGAAMLAGVAGLAAVRRRR